MFFSGKRNKSYKESKRKKRKINGSWKKLHAPRRKFRGGGGAGVGGTIIGNMAVVAVLDFDSWRYRGRDGQRWRKQS